MAAYSCKGALTARPLEGCVGLGPGRRIADDDQVLPVSTEPAGPVAVLARRALARSAQRPPRCPARLGREMPACTARPSGPASGCALRGQASAASPIASRGRAAGSPPPGKRLREISRRRKGLGERNSWSASQRRGLSAPARPSWSWAAHGPPAADSST